MQTTGAAHATRPEPMKLPEKLGKSYDYLAARGHIN